MTKVIRGKANAIVTHVINIELTKLMSCNLLLLVLISHFNKKEILIFWWVSGTFRLVIHKFAPGMNRKNPMNFPEVPTYKTEENVLIFLLVWPLFW